MNRNYGYQFAYNNDGSGFEECAEDYRGPEAFSEPETAAMRDFLIDHPEVKVALNFHAYGPLLIIPYNWDPGHGNRQLPTKAQKFYQDVYKKVPKSYLLGNGVTTIGYTANGEASDWMLHELGIYAASPELGINDRHTDTFFISNIASLTKLI